MFYYSEAQCLESTDLKKQRLLFINTASKTTSKIQEHVFPFIHLPVGSPIRVKEGCWDIIFQLNNGQPQGGYGENFGAMHRPVPLELSSWGQAEFV